MISILGGQDSHHSCLIYPSGRGKGSTPRCFSAAVAPVDMKNIIYFQLVNSGQFLGASFKTHPGQYLPKNLEKGISPTDLVSQYVVIIHIGYNAVYHPKSFPTRVAAILICQLGMIQLSDQKKHGLTKSSQHLGEIYLVFFETNLFG